MISLFIGFKNCEKPDSNGVRFFYVNNIADICIIMTTFEKLKQILLDTQGDVDKFTEKKNQAAGTRVRAAMQQIKALAQEVREQVLNMRKEG